MRICSELMKVAPQREMVICILGIVKYRRKFLPLISFCILVGIELFILWASVTSLSTAKVINWPVMPAPGKSHMYFKKVKTMDHTRLNFTGTLDLPANILFHWLLVTLEHCYWLSINRAQFSYTSIQSELVLLGCDTHWIIKACIPMSTYSSFNHSVSSAAYLPPLPSSSHPL